MPDLPHLDSTLVPESNFTHTKKKAASSLGAQHVTKVVENKTENQVDQNIRKYLAILMDKPLDEYKELEEKASRINEQKERLMNQGFDEEQAMSQIRGEGDGNNYMF